MQSYLPGMPGQQTMQSVRTELRGGVMSGAYVLHHILALFVMPAALFVMVFGFGGTLINPANAYTSWNWWRLYGAMFIVFLIPFVEYWLGQERKVAMTGGAGTTAYNRAQINGIFAAYMVMIVVLGAWISILTVWIGVADFGQCGSSAVCSGVAGGSTPCAGAIMIIVGMGVLALSTWVLFLGGLYVHAAARDAYNARLSLYFPLAAQIGASLDGVAAHIGAAIGGQSPAATMRAIGANLVEAMIDERIGDAMRAVAAEQSHFDRLIGSNVADIGFGLRALITWPRFFTDDADTAPEVSKDDDRAPMVPKCVAAGSEYSL